MNKLVIFLHCLTISFFTASAQVDRNSELFLKMKELDSLIFERGFNHCELAVFEKFMSEDLLFYHDQSGIQNYEEFITNTNTYICADQDQKPIRKLRTSTLEVYPLYNDGQVYGAIQNGIHDFYIRTINGDSWTSTAKFSHVWVKYDSL